ncbi:hypothetical protein T484DRAFT_1894975 [Baffinella frigidus]|nr:hypothetical protein T484DRAFT_1894975 [Cryptophyta sp. CCMP2293]
MLSAFSAASGNALSWLPPFWALFWVMFFACLRAGLEAKALSVSQVVAVMEKAGILMSFCWPFAAQAIVGNAFRAADIALWSPVASLIVNHHHPLRDSLVLLLLRALAFSLLLFFEWHGDLQHKDEQQLDPRARSAILSATHILCPLVVAVGVRRSIEHFIEWRCHLVDILHQLQAQHERTEQLLKSIVPPSEAPSLRLIRPDVWNTIQPIHYPSCTLVVMDLTGFTTLGTQMRAAELVDILNAVFTAIDKAADLIGLVWKVETAGDSYIAMVGGGVDCSRRDHATRATVLAYSIVQLLHNISSRLGFDVTCRCGVHTGSVVGGMVGTLLPRFLIYGTDLDIAKLLETSCDHCAVQVSEATKRLIGDEWELEGPRSVPHPACPDIAAYTIRWGPGGIKALVAATGGNESSVARFLSCFSLSSHDHDSPIASTAQRVSMQALPTQNTARVLSLGSRSERPAQDRPAPVTRRLSAPDPIRTVPENASSSPLAGGGMEAVRTVPETPLASDSSCSSYSTLRRTSEPEPGPQTRPESVPGAAQLQSFDPESPINEITSLDSSSRVSPLLTSASTGHVSPLLLSASQNSLLGDSALFKSLANMAFSFKHKACEATANPEGGVIDVQGLEFQALILRLVLVGFGLQMTFAAAILVALHTVETQAPSYICGGLAVVSFSMSIGAYWNRSFGENGWARKAAEMMIFMAPAYCAVRSPP